MYMGIKLDKTFKSKYFHKVHQTFLILKYTASLFGARVLFQSVLINTYGITVSLRAHDGQVYK